MIILFIILIAFVIACIWISGFRQDHYWRGYRQALNTPYDDLHLIDILKEGDAYCHPASSSTPKPIKKKWIGRNIFDLLLEDQIESPFDFYRPNPKFRDKNLP